MLPACSQSTRDRGWTHSPRGRARVRRREGGQGGGRRAGTQREGGWSAGGANATPGLVGLLQGFVFSSTPASLAPGPKGALVLSNSLVNGWMKECERGWGGGGQGAGRESRWLGEGEERSGGGEAATGGRAEEEGGGWGGRACWSGIWLAGDGGCEGPGSLPAHQPGLNLVAPRSPRLQASLLPYKSFGVICPPWPNPHCELSGRHLCFLSYFLGTQSVRGRWPSGSRTPAWPGGLSSVRLRANPGLNMLCCPRLH